MKEDLLQDMYVCSRIVAPCFASVLLFLENEPFPDPTMRLTKTDFWIFFSVFLLYFGLSALTSGFSDPLWLGFSIKLLISLLVSSLCLFIWRRMGRQIWENYRDLNQEE
jgi:hypothetical protein